MRNGDLWEDARRLLTAAYEQQVAREAEVTRVDLVAGAQELGLGLGSPRLRAMVDLAEVAGWVEPDPFARTVAGGTARRITARGLQVLREP